MRLAVFILLGLALLGITTVRTSASELCPARLDIHAAGSENDDRPSALFGFTLNAGSARTVSATLALETSAGWYKATVPSAAIAQALQHFIRRDGSTYAMTAWQSPVMYVRFPAPVELLNGFVLGANGNACPPQARFARTVLNRGVTPLARPDPNYPDPTRAAPYAGASVLPATSVPPIYGTACAQPFRTASVKAPVPPDYPQDAILHGARGATEILVTINADGSLADASVLQSSGEFVLDQAALKAAQQTTYENAIAYCQPVPGSYLFKVTYS